MGNGVNAELPYSFKYIAVSKACVLPAEQKEHKSVISLYVTQRIKNDTHCKISTISLKINELWQTLVV